MLQRYDRRNADLRYWVNGVLRHRDGPLQDGGRLRPTHAQARLDLLHTLLAG